MTTYRIYEAKKNNGGGLESLGTGWEYIDAGSAQEAADMAVMAREDDEEDAIVIVATDDDGDSAVAYV